jgi:signal transduction histidine kinase
VGPTTDVQHLLDQVEALARGTLPFDRLIVHLRVGNDLTTAVAAQAPAPDPSAPTPSDDAARRVISTGQSVRLVHPAQGREARSIVAVPLLSLGDLAGVLEARSAQVNAYGIREQVLFEALAVLIGGALDSARRYAEVIELETMKSDFIARVSHELRTPITILSGFVETLLAGGESIGPDDRRGILERVEVAAHRLSGLIDELLTLGQLESGAVVAAMVDTDLVAIATAARDSAVRPDVVTVDAPAAAPVRTDPDLVGRALGMLVDNAIKYAGSCLLRVAERSIEVVDRGPGIDVAHRARVFETFTRASSHTTVPGMGIGLPVARTLLAAAGAELRMIEPVDDVGTTMVVEFTGPS